MRLLPRTTSLPRMVIPLALLAVWSGALRSHAADIAPATAFVKKFCVECHGPTNAEAEIDLPQLLADPGAYPAAHRVLEAVMDATEFGDMPPRKAAAQPTEAERAALVSWARAALADLEGRQSGDPGLVVMPRLTRDEYRRVLRDLTGVEITAADLLPSEGGAGEGFSNVGEAHAVSLSHIESFLAAAKMTVRHLVATPEGWVWHRVPLPVAGDQRRVGANLLAMIQQWHTDHETRFYEGLAASVAPWAGRHGLERANERVMLALMEAAWRWRHRSEWGAGGRDDEAIARGISPALPRSLLERVAGQVEEPSEALHPYHQALLREWRGLPGPRALDDTQRFEKHANLVQRWFRARRPAQLSGAPSIERSYAQGQAREQTQRRAREGVWSFDLELGGLAVVHLVTAGLGEFNPEDHVIWENGVFVFKDGAEKPWQAEQARVEGRPAGRGRGRLEVRAPAVISVSVPTGAVAFRVDARLPDAERERATVQVVALDREPRADELLFFPDRAPLGDPNAGALRDAFARLGAGGGTFHSRLDYSKKPVPADGWITPEARRFLALGDPAGDPARQAPANDEGFPRPALLLPADIGAIASPRERAQRDKLYRLLNQLGSESSAETLREAARGQLLPFMERAWRRAVTAEEASETLALFEAAIGAGSTYDAAIKRSLTAVLLSPNFLYRMRRSLPSEGRGSERIVPLTGEELASQLSFAIWASIPDEELRRLARDGTLREPDVLRAQARRLLADERGRAFAEEFAGQWFRFQGFADFREPDGKLFPEFTPAVAAAMHQEILLFFDDLFRNDRSILRVLDADETFLNETLARHYGVEGVQGDEMRRVSLRGTPRRGVAGMGVPLVLNSGAQRTSPVRRGVYLVEELLGEHLPVPPSVPPLSDGERSAEGLTIVQQLQRHREDPSCASCHQRFDALGIALENFDAIGRWRETDSTGQPLATRDRLADGAVLDGAAALTRYLVAEQDRFVRQFCRNLLGYVLGRAIQAGDRQLLDEMQAALVANGHRPSAALDVVLGSLQFLNRRGAETGEVPPAASPSTPAISVRP